MKLDNEEMNVVGFIVTWVVGLFGFGRAYGSLATKTEKNTQDIAEIQKEFRTVDGDQRLMSFAAHDKIQATCQARMDERHNMLASRLAIHDQKLDKILEAVGGKK